MLLYSAIYHCISLLVFCRKLQLPDHIPTYYRNYLIVYREGSMLDQTALLVPADCCLGVHSSITLSTLSFFFPATGSKEKRRSTYSTTKQADEWLAKCMTEYCFLFSHMKYIFSTLKTLTFVANLKCKRKLLTTVDTSWQTSENASS